MMPHLFRIGAAAGLLASYDFSSLPLSDGGNSATIRSRLSTANWAISRASSATVQTSASTVVTTGITTDDPRVGDRGSGRGLVLEPSRTNAITNARNPGGTGWTNDTGTTVTAGYANGPDGSSATANRVAQTTTTRYGTKVVPTGLVANFPYTGSGWFQAPSGTATTQTLVGFNTVNAVPVSTSTTWTRAEVTHTENSTSLGFFVADARNWSGSGGVAAGARDDVADLCQLEKGAYGTEVIITTGSTATRAEDLLTNTVAGGFYPTGRIAMYVKFVAKCSVGGSHDETTNMRLASWSTHSIEIDKTNGKVTCNVGGSSYTTATGFTWSQYDVVEVWVASGGGALATSVWMRKNGGSWTQLSTGSPPTQAAFTPDNTFILCNATGGGGKVLPCWLQQVRFYSPGVSPASGVTA